MIFFRTPNFSPISRNFNEVLWVSKNIQNSRNSHSKNTLFLLPSLFRLCTLWKFKQNKEMKNEKLFFFRIFPQFFSMFDRWMRKVNFTCNSCSLLWLIYSCDTKGTQKIYSRKFNFLKTKISKEKKERQAKNIKWIEIKWKIKGKFVWLRLCMYFST